MGGMGCCSHTHAGAVFHVKQPACSASLSVGGELAALSALIMGLVGATSMEERSEQFGDMGSEDEQSDNGCPSGGHKDSSGRDVLCLPDKGVELG